MPQLTRRMLLCQGCALAAVGCEGLNSVPPDVNVDTGGTDTAAADPTGPAGPPAECTVVAQPGAAGWQGVALADVPQLGEVHGWAQVSVGGRAVNLAQVDVDCYVAMETACTHEGALVEYRPDRGQFVCTRHGAVYVNDGTPILGPTEVPLVTYPAARDGDTIWVHIG